LGQGLARGAGTATFFSHSIQDNEGFSNIAQLILRFNGGNIEANLFYTDDTGTHSIGAVSVSKDVHCIEYREKRESGASAVDGEAEFFVDGISQGAVSDVENFAIWTNVDDLQIEIVDTTNVTGTLFYDEFILDGDDQADLGCGGIFSGYNLVLGGGQV